MVTLRVRKSSSEAYTALDIDDASSLEVTYRTMDAESLDTQCANLTTTLTLPRTATNVETLQALFNVQTLYSAASFDIYGKVDALLGINGNETYGYLSLVSAGQSYEVSFCSGLSVIVGNLEEKSIKTLLSGDTVLFDLDTFDDYYDYWRPDGTRTATAYWDASLKRWDNTIENYCLVIAPTDSDETVTSINIKEGSNKSTSVRYAAYDDDDDTWSFTKGGLTPLQLSSDKTSGLRLCVKLSYVFCKIMESLGYSVDYDTEFFSYRNRYNANIYMAMAKVQGGETDTADTYAPDMTQKDFLVSYLKLFGLYAIFDGDTISIKLRRNYYDITSPMAIDDCIDPSSVSIRPNDYYGEYKGELDSSADTVDYASAQDTHLSGATAINGSVTEDADNVFDGSAFKTCPMLRYRGPVSGCAWSGNSVVWSGVPMCGAHDCALFGGEDGGELIIPAFAEWGTFRLYQDNIHSPSDYWQFYKDGDDNGFWKDYRYTPRGVPFTADTSTYPYNGKLFYNYATPQIIVAEGALNGFFYDIHQSYINTVSAKDAVIIECDAWLTPQQIYIMRQCNILVKLNGIYCRIVQFVVNVAGKAKLTLQKIINPNALKAGQTVFSPYFHTPADLVRLSTDTGSVATGIETNATSITTTVSGTAGISGILNNGRNAVLTAVTLPTFPAYSGEDAIPQALQGKIAYSSTDISDTVSQEVFRIPAAGYADLLEGEEDGEVAVQVTADTTAVIKSRYFAMPDGWTTMVFDRNGAVQLNPTYHAYAQPNGDIVVSFNHDAGTPSADVIVLGFYTGGLASSIFATCEIHVN